MLGGLLERRAVINHICSGDVSLMPELKRDREVREEELIRSGEKSGGKLKLRCLLFLFSLLSLSLHLFVFVCLFTDTKLL